MAYNRDGLESVDCQDIVAGLVLVSGFGERFSVLVIALRKQVAGCNHWPIGIVQRCKMRNPLITLPLAGQARPDAENSNRRTEYGEPHKAEIAAGAVSLGTALHSIKNSTPPFQPGRFVPFT